MIVHCGCCYVREDLSSVYQVSLSLISLSVYFVMLWRCYTPATAVVAPLSPCCGELSRSQPQGDALNEMLSFICDLVRLSRKNFPRQNSAWMLRHLLVVTGLFELVVSVQGQWVSFRRSEVWQGLYTQHHNPVPLSNFLYLHMWSVRSAQMGSGQSGPVTSQSCWGLLKSETVFVYKQLRWQSVRLS